MIRTLIEVAHENQHEHNRQLEAVLDKLGFEPKRGEDHGRFMSDLMNELYDRKMNPGVIVEERRARLHAAWNVDKSEPT